MVTLTKEESNKLYSKLEYNFRKNGSDIVSKLQSDEEVNLTPEEAKTVFSKLEYRFKKSGDSLVEKLSEVKS